MTYTGAKRVESGLPLADKPKPFTVKFLKTGTYTYYCDIHAGMKGTIKVVSKNGKVPSAREDKAALNTQIASTLKTAKRLAHTVVQGNNVERRCGRCRAASSTSASSRSTRPSRRARR